MEFTLTIKGTAHELAALLNLAPVATEPTTLTHELSNGHALPAAPAVEAPVAAVVTPVAAEAPAAAPAKTTRSRGAKVVEMPAAEATPPAPAPAAEAPAPAPVMDGPGEVAEAPADTAAPAIGLDDLRKLMQTKLSHSKKISEWFTEFGAKNLSSLPAEHYEAMYTKLTDLP